MTSLPVFDSLETMVERSLFRTPLLSIYNALQAAEDCLSTSKYVKNGNSTGVDHR
jgi:hypothetical protein